MSGALSLDDFKRVCMGCGKEFNPLWGSFYGKPQDGKIGGVQYTCACGMSHNVSISSEFWREAIEPLFRAAFGRPEMPSFYSIVEVHHDGSLWPTNDLTDDSNLAVSTFNRQTMLHGLTSTEVARSYLVRLVVAEVVMSCDFPAPPPTPERPDTELTETDVDGEESSHDGV